MNVRDYWLLKLPEVRRQFPSTGNLVENFLINDYSITRSILVEMAKINESKTLDKEEIDELTKYIKKDLKQTFLQAQKSISQNKPKKEVFKQIITSIKNIENKNKISSKLYITEETSEQHKSANDVLKKEKELYEYVGFDSYLSEINLKEIFAVGIAAFIVTIAVAIYFGVLVYKYYKGKSEKVTGIILGIVSGLIVYQIAGMAIGLIFGIIYGLIKYLISLFRK